jgi:maltose O-acetyltransferase
MQSFLYKLYLKYHFYTNKLRIRRLKYFGATIGNGTIAYGRFTVINIPNLIIGSNTTINEGVHINCRSSVEIGNNVHISSNVQLHTGKLHLDLLPRIHDKAHIIIEDNVWLACNVVILAGIKIGKNSVVAAGSIVTKDVPPNSLVMGIPAKVIREI